MFDETLSVVLVMVAVVTMSGANNLYCCIKHTRSSERNPIKSCDLWDFINCTGEGDDGFRCFSVDDDNENDTSVGMVVLR
jgi:hypothetical protein